jgi:hypothetical protein
MALIQADREQDQMTQPHDDSVEPVFGTTLFDFRISIEEKKRCKQKHPSLASAPFLTLRA